MERIVKHKTPKHKRRARRGANKAPAQHSQSGFNQNTHVPNKFPLFPRQFQFSSNWNRTIEIDLSAGQFNWTFGLFDYLGHIPEYALQLYSLYRYSRICRTDVTFSVVGESDEANQNFAYEAAMARMPFDQSGSLTPSAIKLIRGSRYALVPTSGFNKCRLGASFGSFDELGNPVFDRTYWQTLAEASNTTPADPNRPVVGLAARVVNGNRCLVSINVSVTYHMQFFELEWNRIPELETAQAGGKPARSRKPLRSPKEVDSFDADEDELFSEKPAPCSKSRGKKAT